MDEQAEHHPWGRTLPERGKKGLTPSSCAWGSVGLWGLTTLALSNLPISPLSSSSIPAHICIYPSCLPAIDGFLRGNKLQKLNWLIMSLTRLLNQRQLVWNALCPHALITLNSNKWPLRSRNNKQRICTFYFRAVFYFIFLFWKCYKSGRNSLHEKPT